MVPYTISIGSPYAMLYTRLNIYFVVVSKYQLNLRSLNLVGVKHILILSGKLILVVIVGAKK